MKYLHIYKADGTSEKREAPTKPTLEEMQKLVGGYIEFVSVLHEGHNRTMVVNEEGLIHNLPLNEEAKKLTGTHIVGDVFVMEGYR